jgi:hypothetical protein
MIAIFGHWVRLRLKPIFAGFFRYFSFVFYGVLVDRLIDRMVLYCIDELFCLFLSFIMLLSLSLSLLRPTLRTFLSRSDRCLSLLVSRQISSQRGRRCS